MPVQKTIDELEQGLKIAEPVMNNFGQILIPAGVIVTDRHIKVLKTWRIPHVYISGNDSDEVELSDELLNLAEIQVRKRIKWFPENKFEEELIEVAKINKAMEILDAK